MSAAGLIGPGPLLLDFDGPICSIFAGYPASRVAQELVQVVRSLGITVPDSVASERDPLEVLRWSGSHAPTAVKQVDDALCAAELRAVELAAPTPYGHEVIVAAHRTGVQVAVVSNNSAAAVAAYLAMQQLSECVTPIVGRPYADPAAMKPHPGPILVAARSLGVTPRECVLVGDSLTDIESARAAGARVIGYANRPWKVTAFVAADAVITSMQDVLLT
ncbi:HAD family phosphatase [Dactylosporangium sp. NPDC049742]|uniref:HAD family hydrolase n=1 Tax=Dactylosporangium sp. NPDC049742 TaxID=3154737 RepID=UPI003420DD37